MMPTSPPHSSPLLQRLGLGRPELRAWAMYDWANSVFVTTVIAAVFPIYFSTVAAADLPNEELALTTAMGLLGPSEAPSPSTAVRRDMLAS